MKTIAEPTAACIPVPVPYVIYNGPILKADRDGVHTALFNQEWLELKLSGNVTTPVRNDRSEAACRI